MSADIVVVMFAGDVIGIVVAAAATADFVMTGGAATLITITAAVDAVVVVDLIEIVAQDCLHCSDLYSDSISPIEIDSVDVIDSIALSPYSMSIDASNCHHHTAERQNHWEICIMKIIWCTQYA